MRVLGNWVIWLLCLLGLLGVLGIGFLDFEVSGFWMYKA